MHYTTKSQEGILESESLIYNKYVFILYYVLYHKLSSTNSCLRVTHVQQIHKHILICVGYIRTHTATHCNTLQHTATHYNRYTSTYLYVLDAYAHTLQHTATHCNTLQQIHKHILICVGCIRVVCTRHTQTQACVCCIHVLYTCVTHIKRLHTHCNTLQHTATQACVCCIHVLYTCVTHIKRLHTHCNTLQHTAAHCNTLQHTATNCNTLQHIVIHIQRLLTTAPRGMAHTSYKERYICSLFMYVTHEPSNCTCIHLDVLNIFMYITNLRAMPREFVTYYISRRAIVHVYI